MSELIITVLILLNGTTTQAQLSADTTKNDIRFSAVSDLNSNLLPQLRNNKENPELNNCASILKEQDTYYLFYNDLIGGWPPEDVQMQYATSTDLKSWKRSNSGIVIHGTPDYFDGSDIEFPFLSDIVKSEGGKFYLYFTYSGKIGMAISEHVEGPYEYYHSPIMLPSTDLGDWDKNGFSSPDVIWDGSKYRMYYAVNLENDSITNPRMAIALAESEDGIHWQKWNDPNTKGVYNTSDPVHIGKPGNWDSYKTEVPRVIHNNGMWLMFYRSDYGSNNWNEGSAYGTLLSNDGYHWTRIQDKPIYEPNGQNIFTLWGAAVILEKDTISLFLEADGPPIYGTRIIQVQGTFSEIIQKHVTSN